MLWQYVSTFCGFGWSILKLKCSCPPLAWEIWSSIDRASVWLYVCVQSSLPFEQVEAVKFKWLVALVALSLALSIVRWHLGHHISLPTYDLRSRKSSGFLFPLYGYSYRQFLNASNALEGRIWHGRWATYHRGLQQMEAETTDPFFQLRLDDIVHLTT